MHIPRMKNCGGGVGLCGVIYCVMLFPSSLWGTLGNPRDRPCNDICLA